MAITRYLDIDSTYRNRLMYPLPGDFVINVNTPSATVPENALDPVILSFPYETDQTSGGSSTTQIALSALSSNIINYYVNSYINIGTEFRKVISYDNTTQVATVDVAFSAAPPALTPYWIRKELPLELAANSYEDTIPVNSTLNTVTLGALASNVDNTYVNKYIFFPDPNPINFEWNIITSYNGTTKVASLLTPLKNIKLAGATYQILQFSYDNYRSLTFNGVNLFGNPVCETIRLINLIVPNANVKGGYGGTLENYPFLYVALYSEKGQTWSQPIESNNPVANKCLFKVPVTFYPNGSWLTLQGSFMSQNIKFRENDDLHMTIFLPTGDILDFYPNNQYTYFQDYKFPVFPDPGNQVQAVFEVIR